MLSPARASVKVLDAKGNLITVTMADGKLELDASQKELCTVFCTPPSTWWADVHYACSTIQLCTWYGDKHMYEYTRKSPDEVKELYKSLGMVSSYWSS